MTRKEYKMREKYCTGNRFPFYDLAGKYLPSGSNAVIVDIGAGSGSFCKYLGLDKKYKNIYLLDGNENTVKKLEKEFGKAASYKAPGKLPFNKGSVDFIHCSHLIEHLYYGQLYEFLSNINQALAPGGILAISTPLLWDRFYEDFSHVKPYGHKIFKYYLCQEKENASSEAISNNYEIKELVFRYRDSFDDSWGSRFFIVDIAMKLWRRLLYRIGIKKYIKNGYTIILKKKK